MSFKAQLILGKKIGKGSYGFVHAGEDHVHGKVAVKILKRRPGESNAKWATRSAVLLDEATHLKAATHPNVVQVHNVVRESTTDVVHLVTEFCEGGSIDKVYKKGPLTLPEVRKIITDACRGLEHIHSRGMIHRDIKPGNILRKGAAYKISDFGLVTNDLVLGYASANGYVCHLAPEVFDDPARGTHGTTSRRTDIWAMGMTIYRLLNGHRRHELNFPSSMSIDDFTQKILAGGFSHSLDWLPHIPDSWRKFVHKAMHDDPGHRYQTALAMSQGLAKLPIKPPWACSVSRNEITWKLKERKRTITVKWKIHSPRRHEWYATRSGGGKRTISAGGVQEKIITSTAARTELEEFFANWA